MLERIARALSDDVWVIAPETEQSGVSRALTLTMPVRVRAAGAQRFAVTGTPTDCVLLGVNELIEGAKPDLVLSGVNRGCNVAEDITYSGTIAGAMEGTLLGIPSIAVSQELTEKKPMLWKTSEHFVKEVLQKLKGFNFPEGNLLSINIPNLPVGKVKGTVIAAQGQRKFEGLPDKRFDPKGRAYYWIGGTGFNQKPDHPDSDHAKLHAGYVTVTPLSLKLTNLELMREMNLLFSKMKRRKR